MRMMAVIMIGLVGVTHSFYAGTRLISTSPHTGSLVYRYDAMRVIGVAIKSYSRPRRAWTHYAERWKAGSYRVPSLVLSSSTSKSSVSSSSTTVASESMVTPFYHNSTTTTTTTELTADSAYIERRNTASPHNAPSKLLQSVVDAYHRKDISLFIGLLKDCAAKNHRLDILPSIAYPRMKALLDDDGIDRDACRLSDSIICNMLWIVGRYLTYLPTSSSSS